MLHTPGILSPGFSFMGGKEAGDIPRVRTSRLVVMSRQHLADAIEGHTDRGKKSD
jgi:hypothetical protein